jgi:hypothetical protein
MVRSTPLLSFRQLPCLRFVKVNHPLPLTPRQSKKLLDVLKASFRAQLDREYGPWHRENNSKASPSSPQHTSIRPRSHSQPGSTPTDRHIHSVLSNPLFNYSSKKASGENGPRDPLDIFDEAQANGFMKIEYATKCLEAKMRLIIGSSILSVSGEVKASRGGSKVLQWLASNGLANDTAFLQNQAFSSILIKFLVAEGLQEAIWGWMEMIFSELSTTGKKPNSNTSQVAAFVLLQLIKSEAALDSISLISLDAAYRSFARAVDCLKGLPQYPNASETNRKVLRRAGLFLSVQSTSRSSHYLPASPAAFESFINMVPHFYPHPDFVQSRLLLYHPTQPDARGALEYLKQVVKKSPSLTTPASSKEASRNVHLGLEAAKVLFEQGHASDAKWVMYFLQTRYREQLGVSDAYEQQFKRVLDLSSIHGGLELT